MARTAPPRCRDGTCQRVGIHDICTGGEITAHYDNVVRFVNLPHVGSELQHPVLRNAGIVDPHHLRTRNRGRQLPARCTQCARLQQLLQLPLIQGTGRALLLLPLRGCVAVEHVL